MGVANANISVKFIVDKITVDPVCPNRFASEPENGHLVRMDVRIETTPQMPTDGATRSTRSTSRRSGRTG
ncbi:hypothetical protein GCM10023215_21140 [Pseudonocardia yuanmonensis]|uniref:Uncharacterized protein n=1 Tax=Pseudonocardia yuanmonensis TaxID=1095914 RepID=A0ABP8WBE3_9PSEU